MENTLEAVSVESYTLAGIYVPTQKEDWPISHGNCFTVLTEGGKSYRIVDFAYENLEEALRRGLTWPIKIFPLSACVAVIHDPRIPDDWYRDYWCEVCCPEELLPLPQILAHKRQIARGEREAGDGFIKIDTAKSPKL